MKYEIDPTCYRQVFVLPKEIVEKHIKLAGALQLKVLLWLFYHQGVLEGLDAIAEDLGASPSDVQDALEYWIAGNILKNAEAAPCNPKADTSLSRATEITVAPSKATQSRTQKPGHFEVARRLNECPELAYLICESQSKFGRSLTENEQSTLTFLVDTYGLSPAIILMVIEYACSMEKCNIRFIESTAVNWAKNEIDTVAKAEEHLTHLEQARIRWNTVCRVFGTDKRKPSRQEEIYIARWMEEWRFGVDMLKEAYDQCVNNTGKVSFPYIDKVLSKWHDAGYHKPSDIKDDREASQRHKNSKELKRTSEEKTRSYNIDEIEDLI